ncbi:MAG: M24 family metallopeptidase [Albidovulum sp.]|nr:M24 family metallopeptidase [Albidovulum sp.]
MILSSTDNVIKRGEALGFDVGGTVKGYASDPARTNRDCQSSKVMADFFDWTMQLRRKADICFERDKSPAELIDVVENESAARRMQTSGVGRAGHGVGFETTEYSSLAALEGILFRPGMDFACNLNFSKQFGFIIAENNWVVTETGAESLSGLMADLQMRTIRNTIHRPESDSAGPFHSEEV